MPSYYAFPGLKQSQLTSRERRQLKGRPKNVHQFILQTICDYYNVPEEKVRQRNRKREWVWCRHVFFYLCWKYTGLSLKQIANFLGGFDHTTVIHGRDTVLDIMQYNEIKRSEVRHIESLVI